MWGANPSCHQTVTPRATAWPHIFFPRLFTVEETRNIRNTTFRNILAAVTHADPKELQPCVFVWREGECKWQGTGGKRHQRVREESRPISVTQSVTQ